jgi:hypothetical protein
MTTTLEREEAPPVPRRRTVDLAALARAREVRYQERVERHRADATLNPQLRAAYESRKVIRLEDLMRLLGYAANSRGKLSRMSDNGRPLVGEDGTVDVDVLFRAGFLPRADFVLNPGLGKDTAEDMLTSGILDEGVISVGRIFPAWFEGTVLEALVKDHRLLFDASTGAFTPNRNYRDGRPPGSRNPND